MASLVTPEELIVFLDLPADTQPTDRAQMVVDQASAIVRSACGWQISQVTETFTVPVRSGILILPTLYLTTVTSVTAGGVLLDPAGYTFTASGIISPATGYRFWSSPATVLATHGYTAEAMPADVKGACLQLSARLYFNPLSVRSETVGDVSSDYGSSTSMGLVNATFAPYVLPRVQ